MISRLSTGKITTRKIYSGESTVFTECDEARNLVFSITSLCKSTPRNTATQQDATHCATSLLQLCNELVSTQHCASLYFRTRFCSGGWAFHGNRCDGRMATRASAPPQQGMPIFPLFTFVQWANLTLVRKCRKLSPKCHNKPLFRLLPYSSIVVQHPRASPPNLRTIALSVRSADGAPHTLITHQCTVSKGHQTICRRYPNHDLHHDWSIVPLKLSPSILPMRSMNLLFLIHQDSHIPQDRVLLTQQIS